ncbi:MAG: carbohydrate-binding domain-containing protein, partial [Clostridia bacterium]|nr:carbohydrate-binding domain-containing protein [Clostridia bacterium]
MSLKNRITAALLTACFALSAAGCQPTNAPPDTTDPTSTTTPTNSVTADASAVTELFDEHDQNSTPDLSTATVITLADNGTTVQGDGASVDGNIVTVSAEGVYRLTGALSDGQVRVEAAGALVHLVFDGVSLHSEHTAPLFVRKADKVVLTLQKGSQNTLSDSAAAVYEDTENEEPSGALFSKADLTLNGGGALTVNAAFQDGIVSRDGLKIVDGTVSVCAADDAVMGRDYVLVGGGKLTLTADGDGIKSTNDGGEEVGFVRLQGGTVTVNAQKDGVQATS